MKLKRDLFTIINVREFSDEAQFVDPSLSFVIPQVKKRKITSFINEIKILFQLSLYV
jgi:hypothetical protein